jgi:Type I restriction enzyme R protein N terminus (HSDR_N)
LNSFFDPVREKKVNLLPEEIVRQKIVKALIEKLNYPKSLIALEYSLSKLKHVNSQDIHHYKRRADIICFATKIHSEYEIYPILLIECKACKITPTVFRQVEGYNSIVKSFFYAVANEHEIYTCWIDPITKKTKKVPLLPKYEDLIGAING